MSVPRSIYVLMLFLTAGLLLATSPAEAKRAKDFNDAQIKLLFSGAEVEVEGMELNTRGAGEGFLKFAFSPKGTFTVEYLFVPDSMNSAPKSETDTGKWRVEDDQFCMKFNSSTITSLLKSNIECFLIRFVKNKFVLYSENTAVWKLSVSHPKHSSVEELYVALDTVVGETELVEENTEAETEQETEKAQTANQALLVEIERLKQKAKEARKALEDRNAKDAEERQRLAELEKKKAEDERRRAAELNRKKEAKERQRIATLEKKKNEEAARRKAEEEKRRLAALGKKKKEAARRKAAELKRKKEAEEKRRLAALEKKKKEEAVRRKAEAEKKKKARLASKASTDTKRQSGKPTLEERVATLKRLKDAGLLSEEEFQARRKAVLDEFLGMGGASTSAASQTVPPTLKAKPSKYADVKFGKYYALVIGNNDYKHLPKLKTAAKDAKAVAKTLRDTFGFEVKTLINATRIQILDAFDDYEGKLGKTDNFLIYYAGHGWLDKEREQGFWLPVDAKSSRRSQWISNSTISDALKAFRAKHVMVVADSCFSGTLTRGLKVEKRVVDYVREVVGKRARIALTSGGLEPVEDGGGGKNSPFATAFLKVLNGAGEVLTGTDLFKRVKRPVQVNADQTPNFADIRKAGHDGGDFLFVRTR